MRKLSHFEGPAALRFVLRVLPLSVFALALSACECGTPIDALDRDDAGVAMDDGGERPDSGPDGGDDGGLCLADLATITVTPADQTLQVGLVAGPVAFLATAQRRDGSMVDVTGRLTWTARRDDDSPPGHFVAPGVFQPPAGVGGVITIRATDGCVSGATTLSLRLEAVFQDAGPAATRFDGAVVTASPTKSPTVVYPSDQTRFPRNIYKTLFQWRKAGNDLFRLTFEGPWSKVVIYSDGAHVECQAAPTFGCLETDTAVWQAIAGSNAGQLVTVTIDGVTTGDARVYRATPIQVAFSKRDVKGAIFYWSTTAAGIRRASISDQAPEAYLVARPMATVLPGGVGAVKCVACHTISRSGKKLFAYTEAGVKGEFVYDVTLAPPPVPLITTQIGTQRGFGTFRPDDKRVVATVGDLLAEFDADTGARVSELPVAEGTNPDWSPGETELVFSDRGGDSPGGANLSIIGYDAGTWGSTRLLVPAAGKSNLFPSYSPDATHVAYARGKGGHGDKTLQLWLAKADGSAPPVELVNANRVVNSVLGDGQHENNMPTWAPQGDLHWVAFNTVRPYGVVLPTGGRQQIWVAAIDPAKLGQSLPDGGLVDPSWPAFRFSFQGLAENNHRAFWTLDVRDPPDAGQPPCGGLGSACGAGVTCCAALQCMATVEFGQSCQPTPIDAGSCLGDGAPCSQTSGAACCEAFVCDVTGDGGAACRTAIN